MRIKTRSGGGVFGQASSGMKWVFGAAGGIIVLLVVALMAYWMVQRGRGEGFSSCKYKLMFFTMNGCPHCTAFAPEWKKCKSTLDNGKVCLEEVNADDSARIKLYKVDGFPTIILENTETGQRMPYEGARNVQGITSFLKQNAS